MKRKRRKPEVPEEEVPAEECFDGHARITSKELATTHSVKGGTLQNACSTRPRVVADLGKSALMHIARLMNSLQKGLKRMVTKSAVAMLKKHELYDRTEKPVVCRDTRHEHHGPVVCNSSNTRQLGCVFQDMEPPKSILRKGTDMQKPIQRVKFKKAIARHTKIRRSELSHVPSQPALFPLFRDPGGMLSRSLGMPSRKNGPPSIWDTHGISGNVFANPDAFLQHLILKN